MYLTNDAPSLQNYCSLQANFWHKFCDTFYFRHSSAELLRSRATIADVTDQLEVAMRENKALGVEIGDLKGKTDDDAKRLHEVERDKRR